MRSASGVHPSVTGYYSNAMEKAKDSREVDWSSYSRITIPLWLFWFNSPIWTLFWNNGTYKVIFRK